MQQMCQICKINNASNNPTPFPSTYIYIYIFSSATRAGWPFPLASLKNDYKGHKSYETYMTYIIDPTEYISTV